jgi:hypothetical protein
MRETAAVSRRPQQVPPQNSVTEMTKSENIPASTQDSFVIRISSLIRHSSFVIRHYTP